MPNTVGFIAEGVWVSSLLASPCQRLQAGSWHGSVPAFLPSTLLWQQFHPDTPVCTCCLGCTPVEIVEKICNHNYWDPLGEDCPEELRKVIEQCQAFDPSQRPSAEGKCPFNQLLQQVLYSLFPIGICLALCFGILP